jgi:hypothetical protein
MLAANQPPRKPSREEATMAHEEQLRILKQGVEAWKAWLRQAGNVEIDLSKADLCNADLSGADLSGADLSLSGADLRGAHLSGADLGGANLSRTSLREADLDGANLRKANLLEADLSGADLSVANLAGAYLIEADLSGTYLRGADLSGANLSRTNLRDADLGEANLSGALLYETIISNVDLSGCKNLDSIHHKGPSPIDIRTLQRSGRLPLAFLRGVGLPDALIEYLPSLLGQAIQHYSCFISYSSKDDAFVHRLHADLQDKGVRCWFAPHDMKIGAKILDTLDEAIRLRDKVLLVLSEASIASDWVEDEITKAFAEERQRGGTVLFPVRVDDAVFATKEAWALKLRDNRNIGDFRAWKDHDAYKTALEHVLRDLRVEQASAQEA